MGPPAVAPRRGRQPQRLRAAAGRLMDARSLVLLEFPQVRTRLAELTSFPPSRQLAESLVPDADPVVVARRLDETDQARSLLEERRGAGIGGGPHHRPGVERAGPRGPPRPTPLLGGGRAPP